MHPFSAIVTASGAITFTDAEGASHTITRENPRYEEAKDLLTKIGQTYDAEEQGVFVRELVNIAKPIMAIEANSGGKVTVREGKVIYRDDRGETELHNVVAERIIWMLSEKFDVKPMMLFLEHLMENPSYRSVGDVYRFMEKNKMGITPDGYILAYKKVRPNYTDIHSGTFNNRPGQKPSMRRNEVEDNPDVLCSNGLHVCSYSYLPQFGSGYDARVVVCKVNPKDVVSVPVDHDDAKMRVCEYEVLYEAENYKETDSLSSAPVSDDNGGFSRNDAGCPMCGAYPFDGHCCSSCGYEEEDEADLDDVNSDETPPILQYYRDGRWETLYGHDCNTREEAETYVAAVGQGVRVKPDEGLDLRKAVSGVGEAANGLFGPDAKIAVEMKLDGAGGLNVQMTPQAQPIVKISKEQIANGVRKVIREILGVREKIITNSARLHDNLGADSLDEVELVMGFEEEFDCEIDDNETKPNPTVGEIVDILFEKLNQ